MKTSSFFSVLGIVTLATALLLWCLHLYAPQVRPHGQFAIATLVLFILVCIGLFFAGASMARSKDKNAFTNLVSISVFGKMAIAVGWLFLYQKVSNPVNEWFVAIFLLCYAVYTAFEVWFMTRLARAKA